MVNRQEGPGLNASYESSCSSVMLVLGVLQDTAMLLLLFFSSTIDG